VRFNPNLNVLIPGRGTGKPTVIESLRAVLGLEPIGDDARRAHRGIVEKVLKSGTNISGGHGNAVSLKGAQNLRRRIIFDGLGLRPGSNTPPRAGLWLFSALDTDPARLDSESASAMNIREKLAISV
jgi:hypothetical protein